MSIYTATTMTLVCDKCGRIDEFPEFTRSQVRFSAKEDGGWSRGHVGGHGELGDFCQDCTEAKAERHEQAVSGVGQHSRTPSPGSG